MNKKERIIRILNVVLFVSILFYNLFLDSIKFRFDYILITLFVFLNIKKVYLFIKQRNILLIYMVILYFIYYLMQCVVLNNFFSFISYRYIVLSLLYPILLFIVILSLDFNDKDIKKIYKIFNFLTYVILIYGISNYIFKFNLSSAGSNVFTFSFGRIQSFFNNPNAYSLFLILILCFYLFINQNKKWYEYILISLIILSICLTYSRSGYVIMILIVIVYLIFIMIKSNNSQKYYTLFILLYIFLLTMWLPDNNYLYLSFSNKLDSFFDTNITNNIINTNNSFIWSNISNKEMYNKMIDINNRITSSYATRNIYKEVAKHLYKNNKLIGVGGLNYFEKEREYFRTNNIDYLKVGYPHNNYLFLLARDGIIGLAIIVILIINIMVLIFKMDDKNNFLIIVLISVFLIINLFEDYMIRIGPSNVFYLILGISYKILYFKKRGRESEICFNRMRKNIS